MGLFLWPGFLWPGALLLLLLAPLAVGLYRRRLKRPAKTATLHPDVRLLVEAALQAGAVKRHLPATLYFMACLLALIALARPTYPVPEANPQAGIVLALDVSRSMAATDIAPNRFEAARSALKVFVQGLPAGTRVGLVTFAGYATQVTAPTADHKRLLAAVDLLRMDFGTVIGDALIESMRALPSLEQRENVSDDPQALATVILLTDGRNFGGVEPLAAVQRLKEQKITVHTVGVGSLTEGPIPGIPLQYQFAARFDEATLRTVAAETGGDYVSVESAQELRNVYKNLGRSLIWRFRRDEATALVALAAALFLAASLGWGECRRKVL